MMGICRLCLLESDNEEVIISVYDHKQDLAARIKKCVALEVHSVCLARYLWLK